MKKILVTGSGGLIGSSVVRFFSDLGFCVTGIDGFCRGCLQVVNGLLLLALQDELEGMRVHPLDLIALLRFFLVGFKF